MKNKNIYSNIKSINIDKKVFDHCKQLNKELFSVGTNDFRLINVNKSNYNSDKLERNNYESILRSNAFKYIGMLKESINQSLLIREGIGIYIYPNNDIYFGEWVNNIKFGDGIYIKNNKKNTDNNETFDVYIGNFYPSNSNDVSLISGEGIYISFNNYDSLNFDNSRFIFQIGSFIDNNFSYGLMGTILKNDDFQLYYGSFKDNKRNDDNAYYFSAACDTLYIGKIEDDHYLTDGVIAELDPDNYDNIIKLKYLKKGYIIEDIDIDILANTNSKPNYNLLDIQKKISIFINGLIGEKTYNKINLLFNNNIFYLINDSNINDYLNDKSISKTLNLLNIKGSLNSDIFSILYTYTGIILNNINKIISCNSIVSFNNKNLKEFLTSYSEIVRKNSIKDIPEIEININ